MNGLRNNLFSLVLMFVESLPIGAAGVAEAETSEFNELQLYVMVQYENQNSGETCAAVTFLPTFMLDISNMMAMGSVSGRPAEWSYWHEVFRPLQIDQHISDGISKYDAIGDQDIPPIIHVLYSANALPKDLPADDHPSFSVPSWSMFVSGAAVPVWLVSQSQVETTRCVLVLVRKVRKQSTGQAGVLRTVTTHVLRCDSDGQHFSWVLEDESSQFVPASITQRVKGKDQMGRTH